MFLRLLLYLIPLFVISPSDAALTKCIKTADIAFLIDSSSSIYPPYFDIQRKFVWGIVNLFNVSPEKTQFAAVSFSNVTTNEFNFNTHQNKYDVLNAVDKIKFAKGDATRTYNGLKEINDVVFDSKNGARDNVIKIAIVLTDGGTNPGGYDKYTDAEGKAETQRQAQNARDKGINVFVIGIGPDVDLQELHGIASDPDSNFLIRANKFTELSTNSFKELVRNRTCEAGESTPAPPAPTRPSSTTFLPADEPEKECERKVADVFFVLDESSSIMSQAAFKSELDFVIGTVKNFDIGPDKTRVGVIVFGDSARVVFHLNSFDNKNDVTGAVKKIKWSGGNTFTDQALSLLMNEGFVTGNGARPNVPKIAIILTDGNSTNPYLTKVESKKVQEAEITAFAIGVGTAYKKELITMASKPEYVFQVENLGALKTIEKQLAFGVCKDEQNEEPNKDCEGRIADIMFIADASTSIGETDFKTEMNFIYNVSKKFTIGQNNVQVGLITFSTAAKEVFPLNAFRSKEEIDKALSAVDYTTGLTNTHEALKLMLSDSFSSTNGGRSNVPKICIVITDGWSRKPTETLKFANEAKNNGKITMFSIGVGQYTIQEELNGIASTPTAKYAFKVSDYAALNSIVNSLAKQTCAASARARRRTGLLNFL